MAMLPQDKNQQAIQVLGYSAYAKAAVTGTAADITVTGLGIGYLVADLPINFIPDGTAVSADDAYLPANTILPLDLRGTTGTISVIAADGSSTGVAYFVELA